MRFAQSLRLLGTPPNYHQTVVGTGQRTRLPKWDPTTTDSHGSPMDTDRDSATATSSSEN